MSDTANINSDEDRLIRSRKNNLNQLIDLGIDPYPKVFSRTHSAEEAVKVAQEAGMRKAKVYVKGPGNGRESAIRTIHNNGVEVTEIYDVTPQPHNGCRPPKRRRV